MEQKIDIKTSFDFTAQEMYMIIGGLEALARELDRPALLYMAYEERASAYRKLAKRIDVARGAFLIRLAEERKREQRQQTEETPPAPPAEAGPSENN